MVIMSTVCAEFRDGYGNILHRIGPQERNKPHEAPDGLRKDPLFALLEQDGSLQAVYTKEEAKKLEKIDPTAGIDGAGKRIRKKAEGGEDKSDAGGIAASAEATNDSGDSASSGQKSAGTSISTAGK